MFLKFVESLLLHFLTKNCLLQLLTQVSQLRKKFFLSRT